MDLELMRQWIQENGDERFARSAGPGGQNVNKLNTKVQLRIAVDQLPGLSEAEIERLKERLGGRIDTSGELLVQAQDSRSQIRNREIAVERALALISGALKVRKPRKATRPSFSAKARRIEHKKARGAVKRQRRPPGIDE
ncbi:alternative ribosome rescue aminoacyl-tRNA hydrolase ArfB [Marispirochaeta sp.]|jgi:ribosome-associated protein|uniref:alternative ribosome rescue aminoacyl-tRNA hydrolase ArfB n=1 Tax=Marispirochaeta sp. TaxID=2038653 RepID=UPI0029C7B7CC|nr:alternative ribosome rescue aminoacyl-tRNA hydrolase ArfB [Marispirochaeta sp.]